MRLENLKIQRIKAKVTQFELSKKIGISESMVSKIETGRHDPNSYDTAKIADALGCSVNDLMYDFV